jgi:hypothetical protein
MFSGNFADKPSSRVLRPPGGGSSNIFGACDEQPSEPVKPTEPVKPAESASAQQTAETPSTIVEPPTEVHTNVDSKSEASGKTDSTSAKEAAPKPDSRTSADPAPARGKGRSAYNPITGEAYADVPAVQSNPDKKVTNSIVVKQPPGGASSKLW